MKIKLLCLGDSLTEGYQIKKNTRWTHLLKNDLKIEVINCGISGDTTAGMLARCEQALRDHQPTHMIILGGTNDLWFGLKDEVILSNIHTISRQARFYNVECIIGIPPSVLNLNELNIVHENYSECIRSFQSALIQFSENDDRPFITFSTNLTAEHYLEDGVHINELGQLILKETVRSKMEFLY